RDARHRRSARNDRQEVIPTAAHAAAMLVDQLAQRDAHFLFNIAGLIHMAGDAEEFRAGVVRPAKLGEPLTAAPENIGHDSDGLDIVDGCRRAPQAGIRREGRLQPRLSLLAFKAFEKGRFLPADVSARAVVDVDVEVPAVQIILTDKPSRIGFVDGGLQALALSDEFAANVDIAGVRTHREGGEQAAFYKQVWIVPDDLTVLAGAGLRLIGVHHK